MGNRPPPDAAIVRSARVIVNVIRLRHQRGWSIGVVERKLHEAGFPIRRNAWQRAETAWRRVSVDECWALATVFDMTPIELVEGGDDG